MYLMKTCQEPHLSFSACTPDFRDFRDIKDFKDFKDIKCSKNFRPGFKAFRSVFMEFSDFKSGFMDFRPDFRYLRSDFRTFVHRNSEVVCPSASGLAAARRRAGKIGSLI